MDAVLDISNLVVNLRTDVINPLKAELNPNCHLLSLLGAHHIFHVSGIKVNNKKFPSFSHTVGVRPMWFFLKKKSYYFCIQN